MSQTRKIRNLDLNHIDLLRSVITQQIIKSGYVDFQIIEIHKTHLAFDGNGNPFYEKLRLLRIFQRRLKGCLLYDKENSMIPFLQNAISTLEKIPDESEIYFWIIKADGKQVSGRSTKEQVLHIYPNDRETDLE